MHRYLVIAVVAVTLTAGLLIVPGVARPKASAEVPIIDTLEEAIATMHFSVVGSSGLVLFGRQYVGPRFTLTGPTILTEIGGFVNSCIGTLLGVPRCATALPLTVQIRPSSVNGPDPSIILASFTLSHDNNPLAFSYESVPINLSLEPGTYFVLFVPQDGDVGHLLRSAQHPVGYRAGLMDMGVLDPTSGMSSTVQDSGAVRILGRPQLVWPAAMIFGGGNFTEDDRRLADRLEPYESSKCRTCRFAQDYFLAIHPVPIGAR